MNPNPVPEYLDASFPALLASMPEYPSDSIVDLPSKEFDFPPGFDKNFLPIKEEDHVLRDGRQFPDSNSSTISQIVKLKSVVKNASKIAPKMSNDFSKDENLEKSPKAELEMEQTEHNSKSLGNSDADDSTRQPIENNQCNIESIEADFVFDEHFDDEPINLSISCAEPNRLP